MKIVTNFTSKWVDRINDIAMLVGLSIVAAYGLGAISFTQRGLEDLKLIISFTPAIIAFATVVYSGVIYKAIAGRFKSWPAVVSLVLLGLTVATVTISTGGFESAYLPLWALFLAIVGVFGPLPLAIAWLLSGAYFVANQFGVGEVVDPAQWLVSFIFIQIPVIAGGLFWHNVDATPHKGTIDILSNSLEDEKRKADIVINAIADGVIVVSNTAQSSDQITLINPAAQEILGWTWQEALNLNYQSILKLTDEKDAPIEKNDDPFTTVVRTKQPVQRNDLVLHTKTDKKIDISLTVSPIRNPDGSVSATIGVFRDVSVERREQKQRADFISTASHEMRTPVAAIEGYLALAMNEKVAKIDTKARDYLGKAIESTRHLGKLFQDLLTSAKAEDGRLTSHPKVTDMGALVEKLTEDLRFSAEKKNLLVELEGAARGEGVGTVQPILYAHVDPERLMEVITNIFDNAVKYTEEGRVRIGFTGTNDRITITVADTGAGIPQEDIPHLFQKFYRVDSSATRQVGGTGLGLFITKKIVELYGGRIWVESVVGEGSIFYISLPRIANDKAQEMIRAEANTVTPLDGIGGTGVGI